jgi:hypothetical protein
MSISPAQSISTLYYTFPPPVSPRVFTVLQVVHLSETSPRTGSVGVILVLSIDNKHSTCHRIVVSIPIDLSDEDELLKLEEKGVKGFYVSVERLQESQDGKVIWEMATSSTPNGIIRFFAERMIPSQISAVCHSLYFFFGW